MKAIFNTPITSEELMTEINSIDNSFPNKSWENLYLIITVNPTINKFGNIDFSISENSEIASNQESIKLSELQSLIKSGMDSALVDVVINKLLERYEVIEISENDDFYDILNQDMSNYEVVSNPEFSFLEEEEEEEEKYDYENLETDLLSLLEKETPEDVEFDLIIDEDNKVCYFDSPNPSKFRYAIEGTEVKIY